MNATSSLPALLSLAPYFLCLLFCLWLMVYFLPGRHRPEVGMFLWLMLAEFAWISGFILELIATDLPGKLFWDSMQFAPSLLSSVALLAFARRYSGSKAAFKPIELFALLAPVAAMGALAFVDGSRGIVRVSPRLDLSVPRGELEYGFTPLLWGVFIFYYVIAGWGLALMVRKAAMAKPRSRIKPLLVTVGYCFPFAGMLLSMLGLRLFGHRDLSAVSFTLANLFIALALFRFRLFNLLPVARRVIVESLRDPVLVIDSDGVLLDCNRALTKLLGRHHGPLRGLAVAEAFASWPLAARRALTEFTDECRITLGEGAGRKDFMLDCTTLQKGLPGQARSGSELGRVAVLRDITDIVEAERSLHDWNDALESRIRERTKALEIEVLKCREAESKLRSAGHNIHGTQREIMLTLAELVETRSKETANHVLRVAEYARILSEARGLAPEEVALVADAAPMHDLGKIVIPDGILNKPGRLTDAEMELMRTHTTVGYEILSKSERSLIKTAALIALEHHEHWDGGGYPQGMVAGTISLAGRIVCVCDVFDALAMTRVYKDAWELPRIYEFFREEKGRIFDPALVDLLFLNLDRFLAVAAKYPEEPGHGLPPLGRV